MKIVTAIASLVLAASMGGGFLLLPLLIPVHVWAARRSGPVGRLGWSLLPTVAVGMAVWAAVYVTAGESEPAIWLIPLLAMAGAAVLLRSATSTA